MKWTTLVFLFPLPLPLVTPNFQFRNWSKEYWFIEICKIMSHVVLICFDIEPSPLHLFFKIMIQLVSETNHITLKSRYIPPPPLLVTLIVILGWNRCRKLNTTTSKLMKLLKPILQLLNFWLLLPRLCTSYHLLQIHQISSLPLKGIRGIGNRFCVLRNLVNNVHIVIFDCFLCRCPDFQIYAKLMSTRNSVVAKSEKKMFVW